VNTLLLDVSSWDLCLDAAGNIAMASNPYSIAQDAASAIRTFAGEVWYDTTQGVPYWDQILGQYPPIEFMRAQFVAAALTVPETVSAVCFFSAVVGRALSGQVQITDTARMASIAAFGPTIRSGARRGADSGDTTVAPPAVVPDAPPIDSVDFTDDFTIGDFT
jgi:hypothetical protein